MCSHVFKRRNTGLSTGGDTYDNGVPIVVSGRESLLQGEGEQVMKIMKTGRCARCAQMTPGSTTETVDGMSMAKIEQVIDDLRHERYRWAPVRRTYIAKKNGKLRGLGLPTWSDKLLQEVIRLILEAYYEPQVRHDRRYSIPN